ncbi:MAG: hypothetical protein ACRYG7_15930 [Janthinobacterium lividum]
MFQQLRQLLTSPTAPVQDLSFGLVDTLNIKPLLQQKQWSQFESIANALPADDFTRLLDGLCLTPTYGTLLANYKQSGSSELRYLISGTHATFLAWQARSAVYGRELSQQQIEGFAAFLQEAYEHFNRPFTTALLRAEAAARLVRVAMGLSEPELAQEAFAHCLETNPTHLQAHLFYFNVCTPKWFGSEDTLEDFVDQAPTAGLRELLQAMYLIELYQEISDSSAIVKQKFRNDNGRRLDYTLALHPRPATSLYNIYLDNYLAGLHHALSQFDQRNIFLKELGLATTNYPWMYFGLYWQDVQKIIKR